MTQYCDGQILTNGICNKCFQLAQTSSSYCGRLIQTPTIATTGTFNKATEGEVKELYTKVYSPCGLVVTVGSKWNYDRSLCHSEYTQELTVKEIDNNSGAVVIRFEEKMAYEGYGLGYFDGKIFKLSTPTKVEGKAEATAEGWDERAIEILRKNTLKYQGKLSQLLWKTTVLMSMEEYAELYSKEAHNKAIQEAIDLACVFERNTLIKNLEKLKRG